MRVLFDLQSLHSESAERGVGHYVLALADALRRVPDVTVEILLNADRDAGAVLDARRLIDTYAAGVTVHIVQAPWPWPQGTFDGAAHRLAAAVRAQAIREIGPDVVLVDNVFEPPSSSVLEAGDAVPGAPTAAVLYDLIPLEQADHSFPSADYDRQYRERLACLRDMDCLLSISEHTARSAVTLAGIPAERVVVIGGGPGPVVARAGVGPEAGVAPDPLTRSGLVFVGADDVRKNERGLLEGYARLPAEVRRRHPLHLVGKRAPESAQRLQAHRRRLGLLEGELVLTGRLADSELAELYRTCRAVVMPSFSEGLGLPVLEAWAFDTPVVASDRTSLPEVVGDDEALFDPSDPLAIAAVLRRVLTDDDWWGRLVSGARVRREEFTWERTAGRAAAALRGLHPVSRPGNIAAAAGRGDTDRPRLALVTPWPPQQTGVARHASVMALALGDHYDVTVVAETAEPRTADTPMNPVQFLAEAATFDRVVYQVGNSPFHNFLIPLLRQVPGVVVLHDVDLSIWLSYVLGAGSPELAGLAYRENGLAGWRDGRLSGVELVRAGVGILVHSERAADLLTSGPGSVPPEFVGVAPLVDLSPRRPERDDARRRLGIEPGTVLMATFGRVHPTKRVLEFVRAAEDVAQDSDVIVAVVGQSADDLYQASLARTAAASRADIRITGDVATEDYATWLAASDVVVQLRAGDNGESSAAVVEAMAAGACVVVEDIGSLPETVGDAGVVVPSPLDVDDLCRELRRLVVDADVRTRLGAAARQRAGAHEPAASAAEYRRVIEEHYARRDPRALIDVVASLPVPPERRRRALRTAAENRHDRAAPRLVVDVSELLHRHDLTGIQRVGARLAQHLVEAWPGRTLHAYSAADTGLRETLELVRPHHGPADSRVIASLTGRLEARTGDWLLSARFFPDAAAWERGLLRWRAAGGRVAHIVHDLLPLTHPHWFPQHAVDHFPRYLDVVLRHSDMVLAVSRTTLDALEEQLAARPPDRHLPIGLAHIGLGSDMAADMVVAAPREGRVDGPATVLMVGTIEPRKGYSTALAAFRHLWADGVAVRLVVVGRPGWGPPALLAELTEASRNEPMLEWRQDVDDAELAKLYARADLLLAASEGEGFGLPVVEAARTGLRVLARDLPVFREVAGDSAAYFSDATPGSLAAAIQTELARGRVAAPIMPSLTEWRSTAHDVVTALTGGRAQQP